uniref:Uncharacterized protein n=1 Tax=Setaria italica TaxID=4555 RepID=K3ZGA7_SETIT
MPGRATTVCVVGVKNYPSIFWYSLFLRINVCTLLRYSC